MSGQLESQHFFRSGDEVRGDDGRDGRVLDASALYATIEWDPGIRTEIDQFNPRVVVTHRAAAG